MPTDDDYGRRERLLLHQHPTSQYVHQSATASSLPASSSASSSSSSTTLQKQQQQHPQSIAENPNSVVTAIGIGSLSSVNVGTDCYHKQQQSNQRGTSSTSSGSSVSTSVGCVTAAGISCQQDRYKINERLQSSELPSEYGGRMSHERYEKSSDKQQQHYATKSDDIGVKYGQDTSLSSRTMQSVACDNNVPSSRYVTGACQDQRFGQTAPSSVQINNHGYVTAVTVACSRPSANPLSCQSATSQHSQSSVLADRYSRYTEASSMSGEQRLSLQPNDRYQSIGNDNADQQNNPYGRSSIVPVTVSSSDERTAIVSSNSSKIGVTSEYANSSIITGINVSSGVTSNAIGCTGNSAFSPDTFPSPPSPAPASDRFVPPPPLSPSPSEKYSSSQSLTALCYSNSPCDRILPPNSPGNRERCYVTAPASPMSKDSRYSTLSSERNVHVAERVPLHEAKEQQQQQQQRYGSSSTERLLASASPVLGALRDNDTSRCGIFQIAATSIKDIGTNASCVSSRYSMSSDRLVSSSPIHAPVPERFAATKNNSGERYHTSDSPNHEATLRYHHQHHHRPDTGNSLHHERYTAVSNNTDRYLTSSPNPEVAHGRYSSTERVLSGSGNNEHARESRRYSTSDRSLEGICQKYGDRVESRACSNSASPAADYQCRFSAFPEVTMQPRYPPDQRFGDISSMRYGASPSGQSNTANVISRLETARNDRYSANSANTNNDRYMSNASPGHDSRLVVSADGVRYGTNGGTSAERLMATNASPSSTDAGRYHQAVYGSGVTANCQQTKNDRYGQLSPTPECNNSSTRGYSQSGVTKNSAVNNGTNDKYIQVSKALSYASASERYHQAGQIEQYERTGQERSGYSIDRYGNPTNSAGSDQRYQTSGNNSGLVGYHSVNPERYSPARTTHQDKYLSLPKPKDNFVGGRIVTSCSTLGVGTSATSTNSSSITGNERSYSSTGSSSYVPPNAHTPVERYVPQPPPEILYPDRYGDRYVPPAAHTPTDRYVPAADPGDPYMRRDLGFHHHYRLPPPGYPYHQTHFRFRSFAYVSPGRLGGSPGSSSSSSSTSAQREFSTSPLLRPKVRNSAIEIGSNGRQANAASQANCCADPTRNCCPPVRRSLPPGALPSIPNQSAHSSWQPSPSSGTTGTSTVSSSGTDGESTQSIGMYAVGGEIGKSEKSTTASIPASSSPPVGSSNIGTGGNGPNITRSVSAPAGPRPAVQQSISTNSTGAATSQRPRLRRNMSRTEAIRNYIKRETATFFGVDEESEVLEKQRWLDRRRRMASRKYGALLPEYKPPDPDITRDVPDSTEIPEGVTLRRWQQPVRRKDSVARMTLSGLHYMVETLTRQRPRERSATEPESRSFPPSVISSILQTEVATTNDGGTSVVEDDGEEEAFFRRPPPPPLPPPAAAPAPSTVASSTTGALATTTASAVQIQTDKSEVPENEETENTSGIARGEPNLGLDRDLVEELVRFTPHKDERTSVDGQQVRRPRAITRDHYTSRTTSWRRSRQQDGRSTCDPATGSQQEAGVILRRELSGGTRISPSTIDRVFDNSNRRQYGMGIVGRVFGRSFRKSVAHKPDVRKQLDDIEDHRPFFTYWITTVQVFILIISLACYGFGPVGIDLNRRSGLVLVTSLSLQQVDYDEPANFWLGPRAADLIHLGAKFAPCMRRDFKILNEIDVWRERERDTACCIRNDDSGCVQSSKADCSNTISTWKKWGPGDSGPGGRISGSVCGLDPKFCDAPASVAPYEWPDDITKWPICRKTNPFSQRFRSNNGHQQGNNNFPVGRYKDKMAEHMVCEVIGHPCCIGIHGMCRITTKEYCDFVHGYFHEEASLCSQVECLHDVCGMIPFLHPEWPDQFYRLFTTTFLHAGIMHLAITLLVQYFLMRDLEKLTGSLRIALIYFVGALAGNLASAIFIPHRAEVGPAGAHFALLATLVVEVLNCWPMLKHPRRALTKLIMILVALLILGLLPWVDNYAHLFGFIFGFLAAYALMPFISFGHYDRRRKILLIWICLVLIVGLFALLLALFYNVPVYECEICKLFNCIPFTRDFCASQNINFKKEEPV